MMRRLLLELLAAGVLGMVAGRPHQCSPRARGLDAKKDWISGTTSKDALPSLYDIDIDTLSAGLFSHTFTSVDLTQAYIARILEINDQLRPVTEINPDALVIASKLDQERADGRIRGHGKNNAAHHSSSTTDKRPDGQIATNDKMNNTAGSYALLGAKVSSDSTVAKKLREAGAIILGKTVPSEWGNFRMRSSTGNGWSPYGGQTQGPFYPQQDPSGSSSGSAVAAALGLAPACLGGETTGSIIDPSSHNNVVGVKPTMGMVSRHLVIPISSHMDTIGPMTNTVRDAAYVLQSIAGPDPHDNYTSAIPTDATLDFISACRADALKGKRIGVPRNAIKLMSDNSTTWSMVAAFDAALDVLRSAGAIVVEDADFPLAKEFLEDELLNVQLMGGDFVVDLEKYLAHLTHNPYDITTLAQLRQWTQGNGASLEEFPKRDTGWWDMALDSWNNTEPGFWDAYQRALRYADDGGLLWSICRHELDAMVMPSGMAWTWAAAPGAPVVSVPLGAMPSNHTVVTGDDGLVLAGPNIPFGFSFLGTRFSDAKLIGMAYAFEQMTLAQGRIRPYIAPETELEDVIV